MESLSSPATTLGELLVVAPDGPTLRLLGGLLEEAGYTIRHASDEESAMEVIRAQPPELLLIDAATIDDRAWRRLNADPACNALPVICLCAGEDPTEREHAFRRGAVDCLERPWQPAEVLARTRTQLELLRLRQRFQEEVSLRTAALQGSVGELSRELDAQRGIVRRLGLADKVFETTLDAIVVTDASGTVLFANPSFTRVTGYPLAEIRGHRLSLLDEWRHGEEFERAMHERLDREGRWSGEVWNRRRDGNVVPMMQNVSTVRDGDGRVSHYITILTDLSEAKDAQTLIEFLAYHDAVTGLPNRIVANRHFEQCTLRAGERGGLVAVMCVNVDRLPVINHTLGRFFADEVLRRLGTLLSGCLDETGLISRQSGDEFLLLANAANQEAITRLAERICDILGQELVIDERRLAVGGRVGIALFPTDGRELDELVKCADNALHRSRHPQAGAYRFYSREIAAEALARVEMEAHLRHAVANGEFHLVYQPKVSVRDGAMIGAEALLRWQSPRLGFVSPAEFIPLAEETGLVLDIDNWVVHEACRQIAGWIMSGLRPVPVSINISAHQFHQPNLVSMVTDALKENGLPGRAIDLEITEGALIGDVQRATEVLHELKAAGITVSLDDFGTGYSSLSYLKSLPIDTLKLDKSFVDDIHASGGDAAIALTVLALARHLQLTVVAEGVETDRQYAYLREHGCDVIQGYYASKPLPVAAFERLLEERTSLVESPLHA